MVHQNIIVAAALAGLVAGSPAPQMLDMDQINAAPVAATGPGTFVVEEDVTITNNVTVTDPVAPAGSGLTKRTFFNLGRNTNYGAVINTWECLLFRKCQTAPASTTPCTTPAAAPKTTTTSAKPTTAPTTTTTTASRSTTSSTTSSTTTSTTTTSTTTSNAVPTTSAYTTPAPTTAAPSTTTAAPATTSAASSGSCGIHGYDLQNPAAFWSDGSGQFANLETCKGLCLQHDGALSFAFGANTCLCYKAPVLGNINPVDDSPYAFYDISCGGAVPSPSTTTYASSTTSANGACATQPEAGTYCGFINPEDPCAPQPDGHGPGNLTVDAFMTNPDFKQAALSAPSTVNSGSSTYNRVFSNLQGSVSANSYLGLHTLHAYDVNKCAAFCEETNLCTSFNIYIERDPALNPTKNDSTAPTVWGYWCPLPDAITNYKCTLWGSALDASLATNKGQWRKDFEVVITGSNGYDKTNNTTPTCEVTSTVPSSTPSSTTAAPSTAAPTTTAIQTTAAPTTGKLSTTVKSSLTTSVKTTVKTTAASNPTSPVPKWKPGKNCGGKAVNNPKRWMGSKVFPGPFNAQICGDYAIAQNAANKAAAIQAGLKTWTPCKYVNAIYYHRNGIPYGTYCNLYDVAVDSSFETYTGGWVGKDSYSCKQSWTFELDVDVNFGKC
ncbi:hypothetical protein KVT40_002551 [Elsinoe batatas]|uniref:Apple domain-containing protein n=1 Tax=Elsinoe batatas TaxID=2601811 RepID=A0A8K0L6M5_9PEZI|nr:hypothetical protein KVT40_002551 [Elsinoe batatas]